MLSIQLQTAKTLLLLDESVYYTNNIRRLTVDLKKSFDEKNKSRLDTADENFEDMKELMMQYRALNKN